MSTVTSPQDTSSAFLQDTSPARGLSAAAGGRAKHSLAICVWRRLVEAVASFFFTAGVQQNEDHLVEVVRRDPVAASRVIQSIALFSILGNLVVGVACTLFVALYWSQCGNCERPLRWWLLVQAALQVSQLPVRCVLLLSVHRASQPAATQQGGEEAGGVGGLEACIISLTASPAWRTSKRVAFVQYAWFVLGMVWWLHVDSCPSCPGIGRLTAAVMFLSAARAVAALATFRMLFAVDGGEEAAPAAVGATPEAIAGLPLLRFAPEASDEGASCSICLCDFKANTLLRRLPCGHDFHRRCVDQWLSRSKRCPLCVQAIDAPCRASLRRGGACAAVGAPRAGPGPEPAER